MPLTSFRMLLIAAATSVVLSGCGAEESTPDSQEPVAPETPAQQAAPGVQNEIVERMDPDGKGMHLTAKSPAGKQFEASIGEHVEIPDEYPGDVPVFPGSTPMASMSSPDEGIIVTFKSSGGQMEIFGFYKSSLAESGWILGEETMFGNVLSLEAAKDSRTVSVVVTGTEGDARISVIVAPEG